MNDTRFEAVVSNGSENIAQAPVSVSPRQLRSILLVMAAGNFAIGMGAHVAIGILSPIAEHFSLSKAEAGWIVTVYAMSYGVLSPLLVALTGKIGRRRMLLISLTVFLAGIAMSAAAQTATMLYVARILTAAGAGMFTPSTASIAFSLSAEERRGSALATVFGGLTLAQALGVPAGSFIGYTFGWQAVFAIVALLSLVVMISLMRIVPRNIPFVVNSLSTLGAALADWRSMISVLFIGSFIGSVYVVYTYQAPLLETDMGFGRDGVTLLLLAAGAGAVAGNWMGGRLNDLIGPRKTLVILCLGQIFFMPFYSMLPLPVWVLLVIAFLWSMMGWSVMVPQQNRLILQTPQRQSVVLALNAAGIYVGASIGSYVGGLILAKYGISALGFGGALCAVFALAHLILSEALPPRGARSQ